MVFPQKFRLCNALKETLSRDGEGRRGTEEVKMKYQSVNAERKSSVVVPGAH